MRNPFVVTGVVDDPSFCNRRQEQDEIKLHIENSQNVLLFSHRRYGKTSLILKVLKQLQNIAPIYVDLYGTTSIEGFIKSLITGASVLEPKSSRFIKLIRESVSGLSISFGFDPISQSPNVSASFNRKPEAADIEAVFQLVQRVARKKRIVIAFDEFQEVAGYDAVTFEKELRRIIQHHSNISYIFAGSQRHIITLMFNDAKRAFYQMAISMPLKRIAAADYIDWVQTLYKKGGKAIDEMAIRDVVARCENHPKYVQEFFYFLWPLKETGTDQINRVENTIIEKRALEFMNVWDSLSLNQKKTLKLVTATSGGQLFSANNLAQFQLKTASQVVAALKVLEQRELLSKNGEYRIYDPIFRKWIARFA
jgi:AAA+ ATPase superfamily predicted ATPase